MVKPLRRSLTKNPSIFSHEFVIQNHTDIVSCIAIFFVIGFMIPATTSVASIFITLQHNATGLDETPLFTPGAKDLAAIFFYSLICIVIHAVIQEYALDKISKRLHLSKSKLAGFNISGQLAVFYVASIICGIDVALREHFIPDISMIWITYPAPMSFLLKIYLIIQLAYVFHELPELYFQRVKREEYSSRAIKSIATFGIIAIPYVLNFNRLLVCLLVLHHIAEFIYHVAQLVETMDKEDRFSKSTRLLSNISHILARLGTIILSVVTLWYGLAKTQAQQFSFQTGYFNTFPIRMVVLGSILLLQMYLIFNLIRRELARSTEDQTTISPKLRNQKKDKSKKGKKAIRDESDLPEVDQNTNKALRSKQKTK